MADIYSFNAEMNEQQPELPAELVPSEQVLEAELTQNVIVTNYDDTELRQLIAQRPTMEDSFKLLERVTPQFFGGIGDGIADDTDALQAAIDSGLPVYLPIGCYRITRPLTCTKTRCFVLVGENGGGGISNHINESVKDTRNKTYSVIREDFTSDGTILDLVNFGPTYTGGNSIVIKDIVFASNRYTCSISTTARNETIDPITVNGVHTPQCLTMIDNCTFVGFSGYGLYSEKQHTTMGHLAFTRCKTALVMGSHDHRLHDIWICQCGTGMHFKLDGVGTHFSLNEVWIDQIYGNAIESERAACILCVNVWLDLIGGCAYKNLSASGALMGYYIGRVSRANVFDGDGAFESSTVFGFKLMLDGDDAKGDYENKPLFRNYGSARNNVVIAPGRTAIFSSPVGTNPETGKEWQNTIFGQGIFKLAWGGTNYAAELPLTENPSGWSFTEAQQRAAQEKLGILSVEEVLF